MNELRVFDFIVEQLFDLAHVVSDHQLQLPIFLHCHLMVMLSDVYLICATIPLFPLSPVGLHEEGHRLWFLTTDQVV